MKLGTENGHTPIPRDDKRETYGSGPVTVRKMTPEEEARIALVKPYKPPKTDGASRRTRLGQI